MTFTLGSPWLVKGKCFILGQIEQWISNSKFMFKNCPYNCLLVGYCCNLLNIWCNMETCMYSWFSTKWSFPFVNAVVLSLVLTLISIAVLWHFVYEISILSWPRPQWCLSIFYIRFQRGILKSMTSSIISTFYSSVINPCLIFRHTRVQVSVKAKHVPYTTRYLVVQWRLICNKVHLNRKGTFRESYVSGRHRMHDKDLRSRGGVFVMKPYYNRDNPWCHPLSKTLPVYHGLTTDSLRQTRYYYWFTTEPESSKDLPWWPQMFLTVKHFLQPIRSFSISPLFFRV